MQNSGSPFDVPHHTDTSVVLHDKGLLDAAGITAVPQTLEEGWTWLEFEQVARTLRQSLPADRYPFACTWQGNGVTRWLSWLFEADGRFLAEDLTTPAIASEAGRAAVAFTQSSFPNGFVPVNNSVTSTRCASDTWYAQTAAMTFGGDDLVRQLPRDLPGVLGHHRGRRPGAGYAFAHLRFRGSGVVFPAMLATLVIPLQVDMVRLFRVVTELGIHGSYWAVILPTAASAFGVFLSRQFILGIPRELVEAARIDGAGNLRIFLLVVLPLCRPRIAVLFSTILLQTWNDFAWPLIALEDDQLFTLPIGLLHLQGRFGSDDGGTMAFALIGVVPMVVVFLVFQRCSVQGFARSGLR